ncbi:MAG: hypothetical protein GDA65_02690 [Nitrospira sp. CR1.1]|jgi:hypothetical protein|nr:hypothetical protein [Nitrospira sp. CR1.1]
MATRIHKVKNDEHVEPRLQAARLLERLQAHKEGRLKMTPAQIMAAKIVIAKCIPTPERRTRR